LKWRVHWFGALTGEPRYAKNPIFRLRPPRLEVPPNLINSTHFDFLPLFFFSPLHNNDHNNAFNNAFNFGNAASSRP
jgi:hypothetical protein